MNKFITKLIIGITVSAVTSTLGMEKRKREETPQEVSELGLVASPSKQAKVEHFKKIAVKPLSQKSFTKDTLVQKSAYTIIHTILEGKITLKEVFEKIPVEMCEYIACLPFIHGRTLLYRVSSVEDVKLLLVAGAPLAQEEIISKDKIEINPFIDADSITPLDNFIHCGKIDAAFALIEFLKINNPSLLKKYFSRRTFRLICLRGYQDRFNALFNDFDKQLKKKLDANDKRFQQQNPLLQDLNMLILQGNLESASALVRQDGTLLDFDTQDPIFERTPLMNAITQGYSELASDIIDQMKKNNKPGLSSLDRYKNSALWLAYECAPELVEKLIEHDIDINAELSATGNSILMAVSVPPFSYKFPRLFDIILAKNPTNLNKENGNGETILSLAIIENFSPERIKKIVAAGAEVNFVNEYEETPLMYLNNGSLSAIKVLIERGADVNYRNNEGKCVLRIAIDNLLSGYDALEPINNEKALEILKYLLEYGIHVFENDIEYFDALAKEYEIDLALLSNVRDMLIEKKRVQE